MCVWTEDADAIKWEDKQLKLVYENQRIKDFLHNNRKLGIAATKGQGKTFLIKAKRVQTQNSEVTCFPINDMVDTLDSSMRVNRSLDKLLVNYYGWVTLWKISIAVTIITSDEFKYFFEKKDFTRLKKHSYDLFEIPNDKRRPSIILSHLLGLDYYQLKDILEDAPTLIRLLDKIKSGVYIFIDKVEQAFSEDVYAVNMKSKSQNASYWQYCQYALANAAYEIVSNINVHIKVFYTIRHEALIDSENLAKNTARNIESYMVELIYTKNDLYEMFKIYVQNENDKNLHSPEYKLVNQEKAFFGFERLSHVYVKDVDEKIFDYLYRHSLRRPYDIMKICKELYLHGPKELTIETVRHAINKTSGKVLKQYFSEVEPFITCEYSEIIKLLTCLNTNIFDIEYIHYVCKRYNEEYEMKNICNRDCRNCKNSHPFSSLYNIGILGYLTSSYAHPVQRQMFLPIGGSRLKLNEYSLPKSSLYVLHPCLCDVARELRDGKNKRFETANETIIGEGIEMPDDKISKIKSRRNRLIKKLDQEKVFVSSTINNLQTERDIVKKALYNKGYYPVMSEADNFRYGPNDVNSHDHCINELLKCKQMICVIGKQYGGLYAGNTYKTYAENIRKESQGKIQHPSISLMEFYVGFSKGITYRIFVEKQVMDAHNIYKASGRNYNGDVEKEVFVLIDFINHIEKDGKRAGNWFMVYDSMDRLKHQLSSIDFIKK